MQLDREQQLGVECFCEVSFSSYNCATVIQFFVQSLANDFKRQFISLC
jgi:hypothetical protein